ncbi:hypothetical protein [Vibrio navarrensis]|uniref:hypothetical protein n=1 Tax=Vibrio navarrensis TaxID=29495 RepID=UPI0015598BEB|nr:hypothetical protein [Vibrio navarrensis]MBH9740654.1 hypothetical protein [Vibrio navarrensis]
MSQRKHSSSGEYREMKLFPLPYFSLDMAAEQLDVPVRFFEEAVRCALVRPCVLVDDIKPQKSFSILTGNKEILESAEAYSPSGLSQSDLSRQHSPLIRPRLSNIDDYLSSSASQLNVTYFEPYSEGEAGVEGYLMGFWQIESVDDAIRLLSSLDEIDIEVVPYIDDCWYQDRPIDKAQITILGFPVTVSAKNIVISYKDVKKILDAYQKGVPIDQRTLYGLVKKQTEVKEPVARASQKMMAVLCAVIATHPKLGPSCFDKKVNLHEILSAHFAIEGISLGLFEPDPSTVRRWKQIIDFEKAILRK